MNDQIAARLDFAKQAARDGGALGMKYFNELGSLEVEKKGSQDLVSKADRDVETLIREAIAKSFPDDGIVGEEHDDVVGTSGYTWVIDPIDGTFNFLNAIPAWCVILACVHEDETKIGVIFEPSHDEMFWGSKHGGAFLNDAPMTIADTTGLDDGNLGVGFNSKTERTKVLKFLGELTDRHGLFFRNASGGLMLAYVASGRLIGYAEDRMNAWDCIAGQLLIAEAGGVVEQQSADEMIKNGGRVIAGPKVIFDEIVPMADRAGY